MLKLINNKLHTPTWLFMVLLGVIILRIPSFFEPYSYGDEMIYLTLGEAIRRGVPLYKDIHDNKPPLLYIAAAISGSLFMFKAILTFWSLITVFLFWKLTEVLFPKNGRAQKIATVIFALYTTLPRLEGNIANAENFMIGFIIAGFLLLLRPTLARKKIKPKTAILSGFLFAIAALFKIPAAFDLPAIIFLWIVATARFNKKGIKEIIFNSFYLILGFSLPILATFVWYASRGAFSEYLIAAFLQNFGYLSSWRPDDVREPFLTRNGPLLIRAGVVTLTMFVLYVFRKKLSKKFIFITAWLILTLFAVALSERPYPHYLLQSIAPISLLFSILITDKSLEQSLTILPLTLAFLVPVYFKFWHYDTVHYYTRFINFSSGTINKQQYLDTFGGHVRRNYEIADFITRSSKREDGLFVWGDSSSIYALSRRLPPTKYVADYHIRDFSSDDEIMLSLKLDNPEFVVILPDTPNFSQLNSFLSQNYGVVAKFDKAVIWKLLSPKVRLLLSD